MCIKGQLWIIDLSDFPTNPKESELNQSSIEEFY